MSEKRIILECDLSIVDITDGKLYTLGAGLNVIDDGTQFAHPYLLSISEELKGW